MKNLRKPISQNMNLPILVSLLLSFSSCLCFSEQESIAQSSVIFASLGRSSYAFDIYALPTRHYLQPDHRAELKITDGTSVNFNGHFPTSSSSTHLRRRLNISDPPLELIYITERNGTSSIYYDAVLGPDVPARSQLPLVGNFQTEGQVSIKDRPSLVDDELIFVSTHQESGVPRMSWAAVYSTHLLTGSTRRLTPKGVADFSPAVSPSGRWTAVASFEGRDWAGEVDDLLTDIFVFSTKTGSNRVKVVDHGGWPCWVDDYTLFFHRRSDDDGWWSIYRATLPRVGQIRANSVTVERVTPPGLHAFTPATSPGNTNFIAVATRRPGSDYRHIELFDLVKNEFTELTRPVSPSTHHYNPFLSPDSTRVGYHKCRGIGQSLFLENLQNPRPDISLIRVDGSYPTLSHTGNRVAFVSFPGLFVANTDGSNKREIFKGTAFSTAWDPIRKSVVYTSAGPTFASSGTEVDIISVNVDEEPLSYKKLTIGGQNNAFPYPSPDGKWVVFRSGRSGHKNLYIMDAVDGEKTHIRRLTEGPWTDTMCNWSPDGEWIAFSSNREDPSGRSFAVFMIHPNGTGLRKFMESGSGGRVNHPWFSPDMKSVAFTTDFAGISAEPVSNPHNYQPYGEIYVARFDGTGMQRLTHNSYEDGTPSWGQQIMTPADVTQLKDEACDFDDCHWLNIKSSAPEVSTRVQCGQRVFSTVPANQQMYNYQ